MSTERLFEDIAPESLDLMRSRTQPGDRWAAYENQELGHHLAGLLQFLQIGPGRTFQEPPPRMPDTAVGLGWRYTFIGWVDLATGAITSPEGD